MRRRLGGTGVCLLAVLWSMGCGAMAHEEAELERFETHVRYATAPCDLGVTSPLQLRETSVGAFSAQEILDFALGEHRQALYRVERADGELQFDDGDGRITVMVSSTATTAREFRASQGIVGHGLICQSWLEMDVTVALESDDGAFSARFDAVMYAIHPYLAVIYGRPSAAALRGSYGQQAGPQADGPQAGPQVGQGEGPFAGLDMEIMLTAYGTSGRIWERRTDDAADSDASPPAPGDERDFGRQQLVARWRAPECGERDDFRVPLDVAMEGDTAFDVVARVNELGQLHMAWEGARFSDAEVQMEIEDDGTCVEVYSFLPDMVERRFVGSLALQSTDGQVDGAFMGEVRISDSRSPGRMIFESREPPEPVSPVSPGELGFPMHPAPASTALYSSASLRLNEAGEPQGQVSLGDRSSGDTLLNGEFSW